MRGVERATNEEIRSALRLSADQVRQLMTRVNRRGLAILLQRGLCIIGIAPSPADPRHSGVRGVMREAMANPAM